MDHIQKGCMLLRILVAINSPKAWDAHILNIYKYKIGYSPP